MTEIEFEEVLIACGSDVADRFYPKNDTAAQGGPPSAGGRRGEFLRDLGVLSYLLCNRLVEAGIITRRGSNGQKSAESAVATANEEHDVPGPSQPAS